MKSPPIINTFWNKLSWTQREEGRKENNRWESQGCNIFLLHNLLSQGEVWVDLTQREFRSDNEDSNIYIEIYIFCDASSFIDHVLNNKNNNQIIPPVDLLLCISRKDAVGTASLFLHIFVVVSFCLIFCSYVWSLRGHFM